MTFWDFTLSTIIPSLLFANILLVVLLLINRRTTSNLFRMNFQPLIAAAVLICLALGAAVITYATTTGTLPTSPETPLDSVLKFFPRLASMPAGLRFAVDVVVFACLLICPFWTCRQLIKGRTEAREHRDNALHQLKKANTAASRATQRENELKIKYDGLYAGYLYILNNDKVPKAVREEYSKRIHDAEAACRQSLATQKKPN